MANHWAGLALLPTSTPWQDLLLRPNGFDYVVLAAVKVVYDLTGVELIFWAAAAGAEADVDVAVLELSMHRRRAAALPA